jgi:hypothetical protein
MRVLALAVALFCLSPSALAQDVLTSEQFRARVADAVREASPGADVEFDGPFKLGILLADGAGMVVDIDVLYHRYLANPGSADMLVSRWARDIVSHGAFADALNDRIVALVLPPSGLDELGSASRAFIARPFLGDLTEVLVIAGEDSFETLTLSMLPENGLSAEEAWDLSRVNIASTLDELRAEPFARGVRAISLANGLGTSALTDPALCQASGAHSFFFLVVDKQTFLFADVRHGGDPLAIRDQLARNGATASHTILTCRDGRLVDYEGV